MSIQNVWPVAQVLKTPSLNEDSLKCGQANLLAKIKKPQYWGFFYGYRHDSSDDTATQTHLALI